MTTFADSTSQSIRGEQLSWLTCVLLVLLWWTTAVAVTVVIKATLGHRDESDWTVFPYPFALTCLSNGCVGVLTLLISSFYIYPFPIARVAATAVVDSLDASSESTVQPTDGYQRGNEVESCEATDAVLLDKQLPTPRPQMRRDEVIRLICIGAIQGAEIGCNNKSLEYLTVSARTMLNSSSVLFMMSTAYWFGLERLGFWRLIAAFLLAAGAILQGMPGSPGGDASIVFKSLKSDFSAASDGHVKYVGVLIQITALSLGSVRWAILQMVLQRSPPDSALSMLSKLELTSRVMPVTSAVCFVLAVIFEADAFSSAEIFTVGLFGQVVTIASLVTVLFLVELTLIRLTSAVYVTVLGTLHQIPLVLAGVVCFGDRVSPFAVYGFALGIVGALCYARANALDKAESADQHLPMDEAAAATTCASSGDASSRSE